MGARIASAGGQRIARGLSQSLGQAGFVVVSGLARGIDAAAHAGSLETGTVAVLGGGVDDVYPPDNAGLYDQIVERGCVVDRVHSAADGVMVVELSAVNGRELPPWTPGSHIDLILTGADGSVLERQYSLCGDPADRMTYRVAVLHEPDGRGGEDRKSVV